MRSYKPDELFDKTGIFGRNWRTCAQRRPAGWARIPTRTAACCCRPGMPDFRDYAVKCPSPEDGRGDASPGRILARRNENELEVEKFRVFGPDETASNRLEAVYEVTGKELMARIGCRRRRPVSTEAA